MSGMPPRVLLGAVVLALVLCVVLHVTDSSRAARTVAVVVLAVAGVVAAAATHRRRRHGGSGSGSAVDADAGDADADAAVGNGPGTGRLVVGGTLISAITKPPNATNINVEYRDAIAALFAKDTNAFNPRASECKCDQYPVGYVEHHMQHSYAYTIEKSTESDKATYVAYMQQTDAKIPAPLPPCMPHASVLWYAMANGKDTKLKKLSFANQSVGKTSAGDNNAKKFSVHKDCTTPLSAGNLHILTSHQVHNALTAVVADQDSTELRAIIEAVGTTLEHIHWPHDDNKYWDPVSMLARSLMQYSGPVAEHKTHSAECLWQHVLAIDLYAYALRYGSLPEIGNDIAPQKYTDANKDNWIDAEKWKNFHDPTQCTEHCGLAIMHAINCMSTEKLTEERSGYTFTNLLACPGKPDPLDDDSLKKRKTLCAQLHLCSMVRAKHVHQHIVELLVKASINA